MAGLFWLGHYQWLGLVASALVYSVFSGYNACLGGIQNAARQRAIVAVHSGLDAWFKILLVVGVILWFGSSSTAVVLSYALSSLLMTGSHLFFLRRRIRSLGDKSQAPASWGRQMWLYSRPFSIFGVFTWFHLASDRWALQTFSSTEEVGLYAVVFQLGFVPIGLLMGMAMSFLVPILFQRSGSGEDQARNISVHRVAWRAAFVSLIVTLISFLVTFFLHEWMFNLLVSEKFHLVSYLLPWMILGGGFFATGEMIAVKLMSDMKPAKLIIVKIVTAVLGVGLNIYGASQYGLRGVVAALVVFSVIYLFWIAWLAQYSDHISQPSS